jgi:hypothetical protein
MNSNASNVSMKFIILNGVSIVWLVVTQKTNSPPRINLMPILITAAGVIGHQAGDNAGILLQPDRASPSTNHTVPISSPTITFGNPTNKPESHPAIFPSRQPTRAELAILETKELIYASSRTQPIAKSFKRGFSLPPPSFVYGDQSPPDRHTAKHLLSHSIEPSRIRKTLQNYAPGEQVTRKYIWPSTVGEPTQFPFGAPDPKNTRGIYESMTWDPTVRELSDRQRRFSDEHGIRVGVPKKSQGTLPVPGEFRFGRKYLTEKTDECFLTNE